MNLPYDNTDRDSIKKYALLLRKNTLRKILAPEIINQIIKNVSNKGEMGHILEKYYFGYELNNISEPDFPEARLELKSAPTIRGTNRILKSKERLVLNIIDYEAEVEKTWESSSFLCKCKSMLLLFYLYEKEKSVLDLFFLLIDIWEFPESDLQIIKEDWETIVKKIKEGNAHQISEGDTFYLGACTKGQGHGRDLRQQPFSETLAKQRAFSLKSKYLNTIIDKWTESSNLGDIEPIIKSLGEFEGDLTFEQIIEKKFQIYYGKSTDQIYELLNLDLNKSSKNYFAILSLRILGVKKKKAEEFEKAEITLKTIRLDKNKNLRESISFPYFKYKELVKENWEDSTFRNDLDKKFLFVIFQCDEDNNYFLRKVIFWNIPYVDLEGEVKRVWQKTIEMINSGNSDTLPKSSESFICHVRPHGRNKNDVIESVDGKKYVKKCFWINSKYIKKQIIG
jgi:DNA mismatch repair protein MutH